MEGSGLGYETAKFYHAKWDEILWRSIRIFKQSGTSLGIVSEDIHSHGKL